MKANSGKLHFMISKIQFNNVINESDTVELLGITINNILTFNEHVYKLYRNASYKLYALRRIRKYFKRYFKR